MKRVFTIIAATLISVSAITTMAQERISFTPELKQLAEKGDAEAQYNLGVCYKNGYGVPQDYKQAVCWFEKAANYGHVEAQSNLGFCYIKLQDYKQAVYWYEQSAKQGFAAAQYCLGICYANGLGVAQDYKQAVYWWIKAAEQGLSEAKEALEQLK